MHKNLFVSVNLELKNNFYVLILNHKNLHLLSIYRWSLTDCCHLVDLIKTITVYIFWEGARIKIRVKDFINE